MSFRATNIVRRRVIGQPLDHKATRPGFMAPWGSSDPFQRATGRSVALGVVTGLFVSGGIFYMSMRSAWKRMPDTVKNRAAWNQATIERNNKQDNLEHF